jgi:hypothetical protein
MRNTLYLFVNDYAIARGYLPLSTPRVRRLASRVPGPASLGYSGGLTPWRGLAALWAFPRVYLALGTYGVDKRYQFGFDSRLSKHKSALSISQGARRWSMRQTYILPARGTQQTITAYRQSYGLHNSTSRLSQSRLYLLCAGYAGSLHLSKAHLVSVERLALCLYATTQGQGTDQHLARLTHTPTDASGGHLLLWQETVAA